MFLGCQHVCRADMFNKMGLIMKMFKHDVSVDYHRPWKTTNIDLLSKPTVVELLAVGVKFLICM